MRKRLESSSHWFWSGFDPGVACRRASRPRFGTLSLRSVWRPVEVVVMSGLLVGGLSWACRLQGRLCHHYDTLGEAQSVYFECFGLEQDSDKSPTSPVDASSRWGRRGGASPGAGGWSSSDWSGESAQEEIIESNHRIEFFGMAGQKMESGRGNKTAARRATTSRGTEHA